MSDGKIILGVDPGLKGGLVWVDSMKTVLQVEDMPVMARATGKGNQVNASEFASMIGRLKPTVAYVERVASRPGQSSVSTFTFGHGLGILHGVLAAFQIPLHQPTPTSWKKYHKITKKDKDMSRTKAILMYPTLADVFKRKMDIDRAEALMIALYGVHCER